MPKPAPRLETRADVYALALDKPHAKAVLLWLLEQPAVPQARDVVAKALGMRSAHCEIAIVSMEQRHPFILARVGPDGERMGGRFAFIPADAPIRKAWATLAAAPVVVDTSAPIKTMPAPSRVGQFTKKVVANAAQQET